MKKEVNILLPISSVEQKCFLSFINRIKTILKTEDEELIYNEFILNFLPNDLNSEFIDNIKNFSSQLIYFYRHGLSEILINSLLNLILITRIKNIDLIVGNPPWVKLDFLPKTYAEKMRNLCLDQHLFSGQTYMGAISLNICALIANITASKWLTKKGRLSFLMPQTLMTQDAYSGFRNFYLDHKKK